MPIVKTPTTFPLNTLVRGDSAEFNTAFLDFLPSPAERAKLFSFPARWSAPDSFEGKTKWRDYLSAVKDQGSCGGCYAFASTSALSDCFNLRSLGKLHLNLSSARIISCDLLGQYSELVLPRKDKVVSDVYNVYGCGGNTLLEAWLFLYHFGTNTVECFPDSTLIDQQKCSDISSSSFDECVNSTPAVFYRAQHIFAVAGIPEDGGNEYEIRKIIYKFGPVSASMEIFEDFYTFDSRKIYVRQPTARRISGHSVVIDGWGEERGGKFWWVRNSWGKKWGLDGYFKILRGENHCGIEAGVLVGLPDVIGTISPFFSRKNFFQESLVDPRERRDIMTPYTDYGGIDRDTGISRRLLSYEKYANWPKKLKIYYDPRMFFAGHISSIATISSLKVYVVVVLCVCIITLISISRIV